jgi:hypothetical protein
MLVTRKASCLSGNSINPQGSLYQFNSNSDNEGGSKFDAHYTSRIGCQSNKMKMSITANNSSYGRLWYPHG